MLLNLSGKARVSNYDILVNTIKRKKALLLMPYNDNNVGLITVL